MTQYITNCRKCSGVKGIRHTRGCPWSKEDSDALDALPIELHEKTWAEINGLPQDFYENLILKNAKVIGQKMQQKFTNDYTKKIL